MRGWSAISAIALLALTYPLWIQAPSQDTFPQVPLVEALVRVPILIDRLVLGILVVGWVVIARSSSWVGPILVLGAAIFLVCLNQHRFQPWLYQLTVFAAVFLVRNENLQRQLLCWFVVSIYAYSALSKLDFEFLHTVGLQLVDAGLANFVEPDSVSVATRSRLVWLIPTTEFVVAAGVLWPRSRRLAGVCAALMHIGLVFLLGPWGLNHSWGVLVWNLHFVGVAFLLFVLSPRKSDVDESTDSVQATTLGESVEPLPRTRVQASVFESGWLPKVLLAPILVLPFFERMGVWDHWPSWALYAPHSSRVTIEVAFSAMDRLPARLQALMADGDEEIWTRVPIEKWSLSELGVPVYPQGRFQAGVASSIARQIDSPFQVRATLLGVAARLDGKRSRREYLGTSEVQRIESEFWLGAKCRESSSGEDNTP